MSTPDPTRTAIRMLFRAIDEADWGVVEALMHPAVEYEHTGFLPFRGRDAVMNYYRNVRPFTRGEHILESVTQEGDRVVCCGRFTGKRRDGLEISVLFADVIQFENRKIRRRRVYHCEFKAPV
jgi:ketosteroid isomerase-like protein